MELEWRVQKSRSVAKMLTKDEARSFAVAILNFRPVRPLGN
jgi:hypothetical protein